MRRFRATKSDRAKRWFGRFMGNAQCSSCRGSRPRRESAAVQVGGQTLVEVSVMTVTEARGFFHHIELSGAALEIAVVE